ncbi:thiamine pyrophosphate-dependent dehydrogenase E1 component subunit alpha [Aliidongia dinghuensis]|nr:thiamine pyrophosphate-dependent dehydrogenase E1 component subunit alpha [Aliidongia dinghuensis]
MRCVGCSAGFGGTALSVETASRVQKMVRTSRYEALFAQALRIRLFEERLIELYPFDKIQSPVHLSIGQEAVAVGVCESLTREDLLSTTYRGHAFYIAKGGRLPELMAELYGRANGISGGKAGSMHLAAPEVGMMGASAVVASTIPHAVGSALAARLRKTGQLSVVVYGDGATEQGVHHESLNFAALHQLPVLFICENNELAVHTRPDARQAYRIIDHVGTYGIEALRIEEGYDFLRVGDVVGATVEAMRRDGRPRFIEILTRRYKEHVGPGEDFAAGYRSRAEIESWMAKDPLIADADLVADLTPAIMKEIDEAVAFAEAGPLPDRSALLKDVL